MTATPEIIEAMARAMCQADGYDPDEEAWHGFGGNDPTEVPASRGAVEFGVQIKSQRWKFYRNAARRQYLAHCAMDEIERLRKQGHA